LIGKRKRTAIRKSKTVVGIFQSMSVGNSTKSAQKTLDEETILGVPECREVTLRWSPSRMLFSSDFAGKFQKGAPVAGYRT
jgi:hypothetical protein